MAYIPPHLRTRSTGSAQPETPPAAPPDPSEPNLTLDEIKNHFWPANDEEAESNNYVSDGGKGRTLHDSAQTPGELAFVVLYWGANPRWDSEGIIFTKSSLELLPQELAEQHQQSATGGTEEIVNRDGDAGNVEAQAKANTQPDDVPDADSKARKPIAVFKQISAKRQTRGYQFEGWYNIDKLQFLEPHSPGLIRMLEQKWSKQDKYGNTYTPQRRGTDWDKSLALRWAVVKLKIDNDACREKGEPQIERLPERAPRSPRKSSTANKSVNEMLAELRMKDSNTETDGGNSVSAIAAADP